MAYEVIKGNQYFDPGSLTESAHSSVNHYQDFTDFFVPLGQMHHATMHDRGIAAGLEVSGAPGETQLVINAGRGSRWHRPDDRPCRFPRHRGYPLARKP